MLTRSVATVSPMPVKVSVIVAVYNPGPHIEPLIDSLRKQTMPATDFEAIFVDDGSTDGTPERLDRLTAELANLRVIRIAPSGGPSRPRNVGIDDARGEYVQIVDNDDYLAPEALERLHAYATANSSDVVVGREVRNQRAAVGPLFARNRPNAKLGVDPLLALMTPHKMFRRQFLLDNGIRFIEGRRRLEDHPFVIEVYLKAKVISVLSDYPCYFWTIREDKSNAGLKPVDYPSWYDNLGDALRLVETQIDDVELRESLLSYWYRSKVLNRLGAGFAKRSEAEARIQWGAARDVVARHFGTGVQAHQRGILKTRAHLLLTDQYDAARQLGSSELQMSVRHRIEDVRLDDDAIEITVSAWFAYADGTPLRCDVREGRAFYRSPVPLDDRSADALDYTHGLDHPHAGLVVRREGQWTSYNVAGPVHSLAVDPDGTRRVGARFVARLDPEAVRFGNPLGRGVWAVDVYLTSCGWSGIAPLRAEEKPQRPKLLADALLTKRISAAFVSPAGTVAVDVDQTRLPVIARAIGHPALVRREADKILRVPIRRLRGRPGQAVQAALLLRPVGPGDRLRTKATITVGRKGTAFLTASVPARRSVRRVTWRLAVRVRRRRTPLPVVLQSGPLRTMLRPVDDAQSGRVSRHPD
jgi:poly(ribitol-phosphate) beta-N-acetylglucosaminyltransferase